MTIHLGQHESNQKSFCVNAESFKDCKATVSRLLNLYLNCFQLNQPRSLAKNSERGCPERGEVKLLGQPKVMKKFHGPGRANFIDQRTKKKQMKRQNETDCVEQKKNAI